MKLYLIQHGKALTEEKDPKRPLIEEGIRETEKIAELLKVKNVKIDFIWHSKKIRSVQTAQIISKAVSGAKMIERSDMNPLDAVEKFPDEIENAGGDLAIVGHLPFLKYLTSLLLTSKTEPEIVSFIYSGILCLEKKETWNIIWYITPTSC
ncbi:MAG: phosphohistidine phosphatase SixA [Elusimicrobiota bacterium]